MRGVAGTLNRRRRQRAAPPRRWLLYGIRRDHRRWSGDAHHAVELAATEEMLADRKGRGPFFASLRHTVRWRGTLACLWSPEVRLDHHGRECCLSCSTVRHSFLQDSWGN